MEYITNQNILIAILIIIAVLFFIYYPRKESIVNIDLPDILSSPSIKKTGASDLFRMLRDAIESNNNIINANFDEIDNKIKILDDKINSLPNLQNHCIKYGPSNKYSFCLQKDGNVVQYKDKNPVWATNKFN